MAVLVTVAAVMAVFGFVAWACYDAGYGDGWMDHSEGKADNRYLWRRKP